jgi:hypothetical protein
MENYILDKIMVYPNPFAAVASIDMVFSEDQDVSIEVMTVDGEVMKRIFTGNVSANYPYHYELDGTVMASGQYFLKVTAGEHVDFQKINLIRN